MKALKLLLIAIVIIGGIYGIIQVTSKGAEMETPDFTSAQANMWKQRIIGLCQDEKWTMSEYDAIESGVHTDRVTSKGELISMDEELSLKKYLYALSCNYVKEGADKLFQQSFYPDSKIKHFGDALDFLQSKVGKQENNSNLAEAIKLYSSYHQIMNALAFGASAHYSRPLQAYSGGSADGRKARIKGLPYYGSHFSKNSSLSSRVESLDADMAHAEQQYYANLEKCIEDNYKENGSIEELLEDQIRFDEITTNSSAKDKLNEFVNNH